MTRSTEIEPMISYFKKICDQPVWTIQDVSPLEQMGAEQQWWWSGGLAGPAKQRTETAALTAEPEDELGGSRRVKVRPFIIMSFSMTGSKCLHCWVVFFFSCWIYSRSCSLLCVCREGLWDLSLVWWRNKKPLFEIEQFIGFISVGFFCKIK